MTEPHERDPRLAQLFTTRSSDPERQRIRGVICEALRLEAERLPALLASGDDVGGYQVEDVLGVGGQAVVYRARDPELGRLMALKVPHEPVEEELLEEARAAASIEHPRIVRVERLSREPRLHLVMELMPLSLADRLASEPAGLPIEEVRALAGDIVEGLRHAHDKSLVHRDLKPENVLIDAAGRAKLADFGLAAAQQAQATGAGTPLYMAPEQRRPGQPVTAAADAYAFGKLLYAMLSGRLPQTIMPLGQLRPELDAGWDRLIFGLLEEQPEARPAMDAVQQALAALGPPPPAPSASAPPAPAGRSRWLLAARLAGAAAAVGLLGSLLLVYGIAFRGVQRADDLPWAFGLSLACGAAWLVFDGLASAAHQRS